MALPPIITGSPLFKVLTGEPSKPAAEAQQAANVPKSAPPRQDTVSISDDALQKFNELKSDNDARAKAEEVRASLEENAEVTLGLEESA